jgi:hypothetical protein
MATDPMAAGLDPMAVELTKVSLDWSGEDHYDKAVSLPCRQCHTPTKMRDDQRRPCHQWCAEQEAARGLVDARRALIAERFGSATDLTAELLGTHTQAAAAAERGAPR